MVKRIKSPETRTRPRRGVVPTVLFAGAVLLGACGGDDVDATKFDNYSKAKARVTALAGTYEDQRDIPAGVSDQIKADLKGAVSEFKKHTGDSVKELFATVAGGEDYNYFDDASGVTYGALKYKGEDGKTSLILSSDDEAADRHVHLSVSEGNDGYEISFSVSEGGEETRYYTGDSVEVNGDTLKVFGMTDRDGNFDTDDDTSSRLVKFTNDFGRYADTGSDLDYAVDGMDQVDDFLRAFTNAEEAYHQ